MNYIENWIKNNPRESVSKIYSKKFFDIKYRILLIEGLLKKANKKQIKACYMLLEIEYKKIMKFRTNKRCNTITSNV